jgi:hypothetical protein
MRKNLATVELVPADQVPRLLSKARSKQAMSLLKSSATIARASRMLAMKAAEIRGAVLELIDQVETEARSADWPAVYATTHEIRGLAGSAGLTATGRIANGLCHYLDAMTAANLVPDAAVANLHLGAIARSARTEDDTARHGDVVAQELAALVARKLAEIKE